MTQPTQPSEGFAVVQYQLVLPQKQTVVFDPNRLILLNAEIKDDVYGAGTGLHTFQATDPAFLESLKQVMSNADPMLEFRLGFGTPKDMYWLPWQQHIITNYDATYTGTGADAGHLLVINSANSLVRAARVTKITARKGTVAEIVTAIAAENKLAAVVEPTDGQFLLYQSFVDDSQFIGERLLKRAVTTKGRAGFYFYIRDNVLHFHTPDYQATVVQLNYYKSTGTQLTVADISQTQSLWDAGVAGVRLTAHDPYSGQTKEIDSDPNEALRLADTLYLFSTITNGQLNIPYHLSCNPPVEASAIAQYHYQIARQRIFQCTLHLEKTINIRHGDLLNVSIVQQSAAASCHSGYYYVTSVLYVVEKSAVTTVYTLNRGEVRGQDQSLSVKNASQQLEPESKAPGVDPNIPAVQSSTLTAGAGNYSSATAYTTVADANTGKPA